MNHNKVVETLEGLMPEITRSGDPFNVMLKYAREKELTPAQLVRIGQYYNVAKTLNHLKKASLEERGSSYPMVDTEELELAYTGKDKILEKAAFTFEKVASANPDTPVKKFRLAKGGLSKAVPSNTDWGVKEAAAKVKLERVTPYPELKTSMARALQPRFDKRAAEAEMRKIYLELEDELTTVKKAFEDKVRLHPKGFSCFESMHKEASYLYDADDVMQKIADYLEERRLPIKRASAESIKQMVAEKRLIREQFNLENLVKQAKEIYTLQEELEKAAYMSEIALPGKHSEAYRQFTSQLSPEVEQALAEAGQPVDTEGRDTLRRLEKAPALRKPPVPGASSGGGGGRSWFDKLSDQIAAISGTAAAPLAALGAPGAKGLLGSVAPNVKDRQSKLQQSIDYSLSDIQGTHNLQRAMNTDPIISKADPDEVIRITRELRRAKPDIMLDRYLLTMSLREALSLGAIPVSSVKSLMEVNKLQHEGVSGAQHTKEIMYGGALRSAPAKNRRSSYETSH